ncbi:MAG: CHASE2 domain-containing protein [Fibrobacteraceae bacterium]
MFRDVKRKVSKSLKKAIIGATIGLLLVVIVVFFSAPTKTDRFVTALWTHRLENLFYDAFFQWATNREVPKGDANKPIHNDNFSSDIIIVDIDENSLSKLGNYNSWTRDIHTDVVKTLSTAGASAIAFDILFKNADFGESKAKSTIKVLNSLYPQTNWTSQYNSFRHQFDDDSALVEAVQKSGHTIIAGMFSNRNAYRHESQWRPLSTPAWRDSIGTSSTFSISQMTGNGSIISWDLLDNVFPKLARAGAGLGAVNIFPEEDGVVRKVPLIHSFPSTALYPKSETRLYGSLSLEILMHIFHCKAEDVKITLGKEINLGKPFGIYRDSTGTLRTTYPNFSYPMIRALLDYSKQTGMRAKDSASGEFIEIAHHIVAYKDLKGNLSIELPDGTTISGDMANAARNFSWGKTTINAPFSIGQGESPGTILLQNTLNGNESELDKYTVDVLHYFANDIDSLKPGEKKHLSCELDLNYNAVRNAWKTNYGILANDVLKDIARTDPNKIESLSIGEELRFGHERKIPIDSTGEFSLRYKGHFNVAAGLRNFQHISYYDVTKNRLDPELYQGKIFILGSSAPALFDFYSTPHEEHFPAVLVYATTLQNILDEDYLRFSSEHAQLYIILLLAILGLITGLYCPQRLSPFILLSLIAAYLAIALRLFIGNLYIEVARPLIAIVLIYIAALLVRVYFESAERRFLNAAFKQYISPELIDEMVDQEILPALGGTESEITAYFTDIANFSSFSERIGNPSKLVELLNEYLSAMTDILLKHQGTLDKYEGDAIIAFFGAPMQLKNHRQNACETALAMQDTLVNLRKKWANEKDKWPKEISNMHMRIGINSGKIVTGNMGSTMRKNYTMMGDSVNLASRLESISKIYGTECLVSEETIKGLEKDSILYRSIDSIRVIGKCKAVRTYELMCKTSAPEAQQMKKFIDLWERGINLYLAMDWDKAEEIFEQTKKLEPHDPSRDPGHITTPSITYIARCQSYKKAPPQIAESSAWDGVYTAVSK